MKTTLPSLSMAIGLFISPFVWAKPGFLIDADWLDLPTVSGDKPFAGDFAL